MRCLSHLNFLFGGKEFLITSEVIDQYLLAMAFIYMRRAELRVEGVHKDRYFFYALHLAVGKCAYQAKA